MPDKSSIYRRRLGRAALGVGTIAGLVATSFVVAVPAASAAVPAFPDNIVVFPDRDFISVEGYAEHAGETATLEVSRPGVGVMGSAKALVSDSGVAFEVNHPGGVCWGAGTSLNVTPDIKAGDVATVKFADGSSGDTTTSSATVTQDMVLTGSTLTINGSLGADVDPDNMEQRVINPDLVDTDVARRDIRALPGPLTRAPKGGYSSSLEFPTATTFLATYQFDTQATAQIAAAADLGERAMSWQVVDEDGNRQGLTISEFGESGGPGMGGCPAGPTNQNPPAGSATVVRSATDKTVATVNWAPVTPQPGADPVTGYSVEAVNTATSAVQGIRLGDTATRTTLTGLDAAASYTYEVRSMSGTKLSVPFTIAPAAPPPTIPGDTTRPTLTVNPAMGSTLDTVVEASQVSVVSDGQVFYTTDGTSVITGDMPSDTAKLYTGPIPITAQVTVAVAAFDQVGNFNVNQGVYKPPSQGPATLAAPTGLAGTQTQNSVALTWNAVTGADGYQVTVYNAAGVALATQQPVTTVARQTVTGLTPGTSYGFSVATRNAGGLGQTSAIFNKATDAATDRITITTARWKSNDFRIVGTGSVVGRTVQAYRVNADGTAGAAITGAAANVTAAAPPGIGGYSIRLRTGITTNPGRIIVKSNGGGSAGPFTVSNG